MILGFVGFEAVATIGNISIRARIRSVPRLMTDSSRERSLQRVCLLLEIWRACIRGILATESGAIISMAAALKLHVVAEGVETKEQLAFLRRHECETVQGFLYGPPVPA